jgi:ubiquinone biosynthesis protein
MALLRLAVAGLSERLGLARRSSLPRRLHDMLEWLGPTFVRVGQVISLHRDLLPGEYVVALKDCRIARHPFPAKTAVDLGQAVTVDPDQANTVVIAADCSRVGKV